jgi:hypothetical protein
MNTLRLPRLGFLLAWSLALAAGPSIVRAGTAGIHDNAGFFSESARTDAAWNIGEVQKTLKKDICVETFKEIPADLRQGANLQDKAALDRVCEQWAVRRAREQAVNGVYVLLVKDPAHLQAVVGNDTQRQAFTLADRDVLVKTMLTRLRAKDYDAALREGVSFAASTMKNHATRGMRPTSAPGSAPAYQGAPRGESSGGWLLPLVIIGVLVWVARAIFRSLSRGGAAAGAAGAPGMSPAAGGGGGFFRNMLGGMFGAAAGMWMYDQFFGSHGSSAYGSSPDDRFGGSGGGDSAYTGQDTDYTGSGGSFGDDSGGSDFGGGGFGGGDSGGGDSGGGGGDF